MNDITLERLRAINAEVRDAMNQYAYGSRNRTARLVACVVDLRTALKTAEQERDQFSVALDDECALTAELLTERDALQTRVYELEAKWLIATGSVPALTDPRAEPETRG